MLQLDILSGKQAGSRIVARRFPFTVGRSGKDTVQLEDAGVWEEHLTIDLDRPAKAFKVQCRDHASLVVDGEPQRETLLRNGSLIEIGGVKIRFGMTAPRQRTLVFREAAVWIAFVLLWIFQFAAIWWLDR